MSLLVSRELARLSGVQDFWPTHASPTGGRRHPTRLSGAQGRSPDTAGSLPGGEGACRPGGVPVLLILVSRIHLREIEPGLSSRLQKLNSRTSV